MRRLAAILASLHWRRGLRAGFAVASAMIVCRLLHQPMGWAALGGFEAVIVDNGGPYRSRLATIASVLIGGALCAGIGIATPRGIFLGTVVAAAFCFAITYARVISQPLANTSVVIMVLYFAGSGTTDRTLHYALVSSGDYFLGGVWAALLSLFFWPIDPFRPTRFAVAHCFDLLARFTAGMQIAAAPHTSPTQDSHSTNLNREIRQALESAHASLGCTPARAPARTVRARNLSVLLETADILFALAIRLIEAADALPDPIALAQQSTFIEIAQWLSAAESAIAGSLRHRPADNAASFSPRGSHRIQFIARPAARLANAASADPLEQHLLAAWRTALQNLEIAFDAVHAVWTGADPRPGNAIESGFPGPAAPSNWLDPLRQNWTTSSLMMRHAVRIGVVAAVDTLVLHALRLSHGYWLAMTSIIVLQPYGFGTIRKGYQRVVGTVAGALLAALLAATIHSQAAMIFAITLCSVFTLATFAVNYGWYSFFLTPTFVLLSLPYVEDWRFAGIRVLTTFLGALVAIAAMRLIWPENLSHELGRLLARSCCAAATYIRALLLFWSAPPDARPAAERTILAPARRACGLSFQDAEEALDRVMLEPQLLGTGRSNAPSPLAEASLTFTTYMRRLGACITTLAFTGPAGDGAPARLNHYIARLDHLGSLLGAESQTPPCDPPQVTLPSASDQPANIVPIRSNPLSEQMLQRMERQLDILERSAASITAPRPPLSAPQSPGASPEARRTVATI